MVLDSDSEYTRKMIRGIIKIQEEILNIPDLSVNQRDDLKKLRQRLDDLSQQANNDKIRLGLIDFMNNMN